MLFVNYLMIINVIPYVYKDIGMIIIDLKFVDLLVVYILLY